MSMSWGRKVTLTISLLCIAAGSGHFVRKYQAGDFQHTSVVATPTPTEVEAANNRVNETMKKVDLATQEVEKENARYKAKEEEMITTLMELRDTNAKLEQKLKGKPVKPDGLSKEDSALWDTLHSIDK